MPTKYNTGLDGANDWDNLSLAQRLASIQAAIAQIEAEVGISGSAVTTSIDYKLKNAASVNPGHLHSPAGLSAVIDTSAGDIANVAWIGGSAAAGAVGLAADAGHTHVLAAPGAWTPYTPTWTGASTNPVIGNGTLSGRYMTIGKLCAFSVFLSAGSTTTFGSGTYSWALPVAVGASAHALVTSLVSVDIGVGALAPNVTKFSCGSSGAITLWNPTTPVTWASGTTFYVSGVYETA